MALNPQAKAMELNIMMYTLKQEENKMDNKFGKGDLKNGYVVKLRNGVLMFAVCFSQTKLTRILVNKDGGYIELDSINHNLTCKGGILPEFDIIEVYGLSGNPCTSLAIDIKDRPLLWKRIEEVEMTMDEVCKALGKQIKIVEKHEDD